MKAEIICIGDELLIGQVLDTNSNWIANELTKIGITVYQIRAIEDTSEHIVKALNEGKENAELIILTGGLGPTKDDITKNTLIHFFNDTLVKHDATEERIKKMFKKANYPFTKVNALQAMIPSKCIPLKNEWGTAPGMWFEENGKIIISLPGVPGEMKGIMTHRVLPKIVDEFNLPSIVHKTVYTYGMGESMVAERISEWEENLPEFIKLAYLPSYGRLRLRLTGNGSDRNGMGLAINEEIKKLEEIIPDIITGVDEDARIEVVIGKILN